MKNFLKIALVGLFAISVTACSSKPSDAGVMTVQVGKVKRVIYSKVESKPSFMVVLAGAAAGGLIGNQFGGGSGQDWATGVGAVAGGVITDKALTKRYNQVVYEVYLPSEKETIAVVSGNVANTIFKNDAVVIYQNGKKITMDAYGQYSDQKYYLINQKLADGTLQ